MGLTMPIDEENLANKILLNRASAKSRARSWLTASLGEEPETSPSHGTNMNSELTDAPNFNASDENSGVGVVRKDAEDDLSNRQLLGANEALRRKLLSRDAYQKYSQRSRDGVVPNQPRSKKIKVVESDEEEGKAKSLRSSRGRGVEPGSVTSNSIIEDEGGTIATAGKASKLKKRPGSYLDELLASRKGKQSKRAKRRADDD